MKLEIELTVIATIDIPDSNIQKLAKDKGLDWSDKIQQQQAAKAWVSGWIRARRIWYRLSGQRNILEQLSKDFGVEYKFPRDPIVSVRVERTNDETI